MSTDAEILKCCLYGGCACPPDARDRVMFNYCSLVDNGVPRAVSRQQCKTWIEGGLNTDNQTVKSLVSAVCNNKTALENPLCKQYCSASGGACDSASYEYCLEAGETDSYCKCVVLPVSIGQYNPACFWSPCRDTPTAYKTLEQSRQAKSCPAVMDCRQYINIDPSARGNILNNIEMNQTCIQKVNSQSTTTTTNETTNITPTGTTTFPVSENSSQSSDVGIYVALFLLFIIVIVIAVIIAVRRSNKSQYQYNY